MTRFTRAILACCLLPSAVAWADPPTEQVAALPAEYAPWWQAWVESPQRQAARPRPVSQESLLVSALAHSAQVRVFGDLPLIRETAIVEAQGAFDWRAFMESRWQDVSDPVGSTLLTGGPNRYYNEQWSAAAGLRQRNPLGGQVEISQRIGWQDTNSVFFLPGQQATTRLTLSYTQPLLRGAGTKYNRSLIVLAQIDASIAHDEMSRQLQSHLLEVSRAYWSLYLERGALVQRRNLLDQARRVLVELEARRTLDASDSQVARARAALAERQADIFRAEAAASNAEARVRALVNDPDLACGDVELVPRAAPTLLYRGACLGDSLGVALRERPEVRQALKQIQAAATRLEMSRNELLPQLNLVVEAYVSGLRGDSDFGRAYVDQFNVGEPSYSVGLQFDSSICRRAEKARWQRRQLELRQLTNQFKVTTETLSLEVEVAVREVETSYREMQAKHAAIQAAANRLHFITDRWKLLPGEDQHATLFLEDVLNSQQNLADAETGFLKAQMAYNLSLMNLKRAEGTLLQAELVSVGRAEVDCLPMTVYHKSELVEGGPVAGAGPAGEAIEQPSNAPRGEGWRAPAPRARTAPELEAPRSPIIETAPGGEFAPRAQTTPGGGEFQPRMEPRGAPPASDRVRGGGEFRGQPQPPRPPAELLPPPLPQAPGDRPPRGEGDLPAPGEAPPPPPGSATDGPRSTLEPPAIPGADELIPPTPPREPRSSAAPTLRYLRLGK